MALGKPTALYTCKNTRVALIALDCLKQIIQDTKWGRQRRDDGSWRNQGRREHNKNALCTALKELAMRKTAFKNCSIWRLERRECLNGYRTLTDLPEGRRLVCSTERGRVRDMGGTHLL